MLLPCPWCGPRNADEFRYGGEAGPRPDPATTTPEEWRALPVRPANPRGWVTETWYHGSGCRRYFAVERRHRDATRSAGCATPAGRRASPRLRRRPTRGPTTPPRVCRPSRARSSTAAAPLAFTWNGTPLPGHPGDTIASALAAAGRAGVLPQLQVPPAPRAAHRELPRPGLPWCRSATSRTSAARTACVDPGHERQLAEHLAVAALRRQGRQRAGRAVPRRRLLLQDVHQAASGCGPPTRRCCARFAHAGRGPARHRPHGYYDKRYAHPDVLVAGGGPAGMAAAVAAARAGARGDARRGGARARRAPALGRPGRPGRAAELRAQVAAQPGIEVLTDSVVAGRYDDNWIADRAAQPAAASTSG